MTSAVTAPVSTEASSAVAPAPLIMAASTVSAVPVIVTATPISAVPITAASLPVMVIPLVVRVGPAIVRVPSVPVVPTRSAPSPAEGPVEKAGDPTKIDVHIAFDGFNFSSAAASISSTTMAVERRKRHAKNHAENKEKDENCGSDCDDVANEMILGAGHNGNFGKLKNAGQ